MDVLKRRRAWPSCVSSSKDLALHTSRLGQPLAASTGGTGGARRELVVCRSMLRRPLSSSWLVAACVPAGTRVAELRARGKG